MTAGEHELSKLFEGKDYYQGFKLTLADSMLAKEKLDAALKYVYDILLTQSCITAVTCTQTDVKLQCVICCSQAKCGQNCQQGSSHAQS